MSERRRPRSLDEARDRGGQTPPEPEPAVPDDAPEAADLEEVAHWCLLCSDPGVAGPDILGNWYCASHWAEREARLATARRATKAGRRVRAEPQGRSGRDNDLRAETEALLDRLRAARPHGQQDSSHYQERISYRDGNEF